MLAPPQRSGKYFHLHYLTHIFIYKFFFPPRCLLFLFCCSHLFQPSNDFVFLSPSQGVNYCLFMNKFSLFTHSDRELSQVFHSHAQLLPFLRDWVSVYNFSNKSIKLLRKIKFHTTMQK